MGQPDSAGDDQREVNPEEFLRAMLAISPEDAAEAREDATRAAFRAEPEAREGRNA